MLLLFKKNDKYILRYCFNISTYSLTENMKMKTIPNLSYTESLQEYLETQRLETSVLPSRA